MGLVRELALWYNGPPEAAFGAASAANRQMWEVQTMASQEGKGTFVYVGTYTSGRSEGIYVYRFDPSSGALRYAGVARGVSNPSFLALHPRRPFLYAVSESEEQGGASAFAIDPQSGALTRLNQQFSPGGRPCYLSVDATGRLVLAADYHGGTLSVFPIEADGRLGAASDFVRHQGSSVNRERQEAAHAHCILPDPGNRYALAADLGLDKIMVYELDLAQGKLRPHRRPWVQVKPGAGPRHLTFHPNGRYAYLINELDSTIVAYAYDPAGGILTELQTVPALPAGFTGTSWAADVHVAPSGRTVYGSNRGHDSIAIFAIDEGTGKLTPVGHEPTQGQTPRNFAIDPTGTWLLAANQDSDTIVTFRIDPRSGKLAPAGQVAEAPTPVCLKFLTL